MLSVNPLAFQKARGAPLSGAGRNPWLSSPRVSPSMQQCSGAKLRWLQWGCDGGEEEGHRELLHSTRKGGGG